MGTDQSPHRHHRSKRADLKPDPLVCVHVRVLGIVQGVGFRPFVHRLATHLGIDGWVINDDLGVLIELMGQSSVIDRFVDELRLSPPPLAVVESVNVVPVRVADSDAASVQQGFVIRPSTRSPRNAVLVPADVRTCTLCLLEMRDPTNRRHRHPFINCTDCGPRFTLIRAVPYDRANTTMATFAMCAACVAEYTDPGSRRFHAEPICCPGCGPRLYFRPLSAAKPVGEVQTGLPGVAIGQTDEDALSLAIAALKAGQIVAVKGIGGYSLAVDACNDEAVGRLRSRKHRDEKPFALLVPSIDAARNLVDISDTEARGLLGPSAPIVLALRCAEAAGAVSARVAPNNKTLGVMLPSTGLHHLLAEAFDGPLVLTSGNHSDEPIVVSDSVVDRRLGSIADSVLGHDRMIHRRADDSVVKRLGSRLVPLRRASGFVPNAIDLGDGTENHDGPPILGVGAELKSTVCLSRGNKALMSAHLGDLEHVEAFRSFGEAIVDLQAFFGVEPALVVHDLHPEYLSTKWAQEQGIELLAVQHHHAHIASCLADNSAQGPVVGLAFDGHGYGPDGTLWGGEFLIADLVGYDRAGHFRAVSLPGGSTAIRDPWRMAVAQLLEAYSGDIPNDLAVRQRNQDRWSDVEAVARHSHTMKTTSVGRLFDAIAAILGVRDRVLFEGQAAMELEQRAVMALPNMARADSSSNSVDLGIAPIAIGEGDGVVVLDPSHFVRSLANAVGAGTPPLTTIDQLAWIAHRTIADGAVRAAGIICTRVGLDTVALSGGVFQNQLLLDMVQAGLEQLGLTVLVHRDVPPNDGGISLGQVAIGRATHARNHIAQT